MIDEAQLELSSDTRLVPLAMHIAFGFVLALGVLTKGGTVAIPVWNLPTLGEYINLYAITHIALPPSVAMNFIDFVPEGGNPFPSLRLLRIGGSGSSTRLVGALLARFPRIIQVVYGLTELGAVSVAKADVLAGWPMSSGRVLPRFKLEVVDDKDNVLPKDSVGEIRARLDGMPDGYYKDAVNSDRKFRDGWFYTGDVGRISGEGLIFIDGRIDDIINLGGYKVSPGYVEEILTRHPGVKDAIAFAAKEKNGRDVLLAAVILSEGETGKDLADYGKANLGRASPERFIAMRDFPRNSSGKVLRSKLISEALGMEDATE
jgi:acyl-CoA synthetase (AMP-forming)/AMP-acid ligase II